MVKGIETGDSRIYEIACDPSRAYTQDKQANSIPMNLPLLVKHFTAYTPHQYTHKLTQPPFTSVKNML